MAAAKKTATPKKRAPKKAAPKAAAKKAAPKKDEAPKEGVREKARREKAGAIEKARAAQIESGDLLVTKTHEYEKATKDTLSKQRAENILKALDGAKEPILVRELAENLKAYYEEVLPALTMLEALGKVQRYEALAAGRGRRQVAYMLVD